MLAWIQSVWTDKYGAFGLVGHPSLIHWKGGALDAARAGLLDSGLTWFDWQGA